MFLGFSISKLRYQYQCYKLQRCVSILKVVIVIKVLG